MSYCKLVFRYLLSVMIASIYFFGTIFFVLFIQKMAGASKFNSFEEVFVEEATTNLMFITLSLAVILFCSFDISKKISSKKYFYKLNIYFGIAIFVSSVVIFLTFR